MNEIKIKVKFKKGLCYSQGIKLVQNDYNSTKLVFEFDEDEGTKIFELRDSDDNVILADEIVNNELILARFDEHDNAYPIFTKEGEYVYEVSLYKDNSKLTSASDKFKVNAEQVIIDGEIVETYTPMFDNLLSDLSSALQETDNIDIDVSKVDNTSTVTVTKKDGSTKTVNIIDGAKGDKGNTGAPGQAGANATINGVNTLSIEAGTNITLEQEGSTLTINSTGGGSGGTTDYSALTNKPSINNVTLSGNKTISDLGLQPAGNYVTDTDYATEIKAGLVRIDPEFLAFVQETGILCALSVSYDSYGNMYPSAFISKGTLESVITGKGLIDSSYHDSTKQDVIDNTLTTINKTIPTAINEVNSIAKGANQALSYVNYSTMITAFNNLANNVYNVGQNVMIITLQVPDLWISGIESTSQTYTYTTDEAFTTELNTNGYVQVGYYKLSALETQKVNLTNYVTFDDYATGTTTGVVKTSAQYGISTSSYTKNLTGATRTYAQYQSGNDVVIICKGTLENVITGKELDLKQLSTFDSTKTQVLKNINGTLTWVDE